MSWIPMRLRWKKTATLRVRKAVQIWLEMGAPPTEEDVDLLDTVITSWFMIGRLGGYNSMNLQVRPWVPSAGRIAHVTQRLSARTQQCIFWVTSALGLSAN